MTAELYQAIVDAEKAARRAHDLAYSEQVPYVVRSGLGRAQSLLMHNVVKYAGRFGNAEVDEPTRRAFWADMARHLRRKT